MKMGQEKWPKEIVSALKLEIGWGKIRKGRAERGKREEDALKGTLTFVAEVYKESSAGYFYWYVAGKQADS